MPPKKKLKPLGGQTKLSFGKWPEASNHQEQEAATAIEKDDAKTMKNQHKQNLQNVRNKDFLSWHGNYMYCKVCSEASKSNEMSKEAQCRNFQNTMLNRHAALLEHKMALQGPEIRKWFEEPQRKGETKQNKAVQVLFKCVQWLCIESIPLVKFKSLLELLHDLGPEDTAILKQTNISYNSYTTSDDTLQCLSDVIDDELKENLEKSSIVTALADESTDSSIYTQIISEDIKSSTHFVTNI